MTSREAVPARTNFVHLAQHDEQLVRLGMRASSRSRSSSPPTAVRICASSPHAAAPGSAICAIPKISDTRWTAGYTPEGLEDLLERDERQAHEDLRNEPFNYGFPLRDYQQAAIEAVEAAIGRGQREMLLAMATGTGKTKTCIALIYRLLKAKRFRRVLFLVDRSALGEQAANAFKDTRMESLQTFTDVFGIKELDEQKADTDTAVVVNPRSRSPSSAASLPRWHRTTSARSCAISSLPSSSARNDT